MSNRYDVIVIGVGSMGAATCLALAQRGAKVLGLEQFSIPHQGGSHHGGSRMIRQAYFEHPNYVSLLKQVYPLWHDIEQQTREHLFHQIGALYLGRADCELIEGSTRAAVQYDIPHEVIPGREVAARFPAFRRQDEWVGFFEPTAGYLRPEACISAMARLAIQQGATLKAHEAVQQWTPDQRGTICVKSSRGEYHTERLIVCGGAWSTRLLTSLSCPLTVTRQVVAWIWPPNGRNFDQQKLPCWAIDPNPAKQYRGIFYGFPLSTEPPGIKVGWHAPGLISNPDRVDREIRESDLDWLPEFFAAYMPQAGTQLLGASVCLYTYSSDGHFVVDRHPEFPNVCFAAGFSGHGFKFAPIIGQALADLSLEGTTHLPLDFLRLARFNN